VVPSKTSTRASKTTLLATRATPEMVNSNSAKADTPMEVVAEASRVKTASTKISNKFNNLLVR